MVFEMVDQCPLPDVAERTEIVTEINKLVGL